MEGATRAIDKMENSIQNIILEEMESLEGIMIATTNLTTNLDKAFERRFLYKIEFSRPDVEVRSQIWQVMLPIPSALSCQVRTPLICRQLSTFAAANASPLPTGQEWGSGGNEENKSHIFQLRILSSQQHFTFVSSR